jgi:hypothetical protein
MELELQIITISEDVAEQKKLGPVSFLACWFLMQLR